MASFAFVVIECLHCVFVRLPMHMVFAWEANFFAQPFPASSTRIKAFMINF